MVFVQFADAPEEKSIPRHRVVSPRSRENQAIVAAEGGDHDRNRHNGRAGPWEDYVRGLGRDPVARRILDCGERKRSEVSDVCEQIKSDDEEGAEREREWNIASRIFHFAGGEGDVVPCVRGEKRVGLRDADANKKSERGYGRQAWADFLETAAQGPEIAEVFSAGT